MDINCEMMVRRRKDAVCRIIDGEVVVLLPEEAMLHALSGCGSRVWELIEEKTTVSEVVNNICDEYEVEPGIAEGEITEFIRKLAEMKMAEILPAVNDEANN